VPAIACIDTELALRRAGCQTIAGVDEVGRGCWAGPVYAAVVVLPGECYTARSLLAEVIDSKLLSPAKRQRLAAQIVGCARGAAVAWVEAPLIDQLNILGATRLAMQLAIRCLSGTASPDLCPGSGAEPPAGASSAGQMYGAVCLTGQGVRPDFVLTDAVKLPDLDLPQRAIVRGDRSCLAIAAASIVAKVTRDAEMERRHAQYPDLALASNKGYGSRRHIEALHRAGVTPLHRRSFAPMKYLLGVHDYVAGVLPPPAGAAGATLQVPLPRARRARARASSGRR
jgi:ribonuclease HII